MKELNKEKRSIDKPIHIHKPEKKVNEIIILIFYSLKRILFLWEFGF